mmetsp:Transcript_12805/g.36688  ORF Transcript_12805/g.36688 Transcript_12805/m.36688 type:complete len:223 (-) Transcript_12805:461-1129(-)
MPLSMWRSVTRPPCAFGLASRSSRPPVFGSMAKPNSEPSTVPANSLSFVQARLRMSPLSSLYTLDFFVDVSNCLISLHDALKRLVPLLARSRGQPHRFDSRTEYCMSCRNAEEGGLTNSSRDLEWRPIMTPEDDGRTECAGPPDRMMRFATFILFFPLSSESSIWTKHTVLSIPAESSVVSFNHARAVTAEPWAWRAASEGTEGQSDSRRSSRRLSSWSSSS